jgi:hypothetical protein
MYEYNNRNYLIVIRLDTISHLVKYYNYFKIKNTKNTKNTKTIFDIVIIYLTIANKRFIHSTPTQEHVKSQFAGTLYRCIVM